MVVSGIPTLIIISAWDSVTLKTILKNIKVFQIITEVDYSLFTPDLITSDSPHYVFTELELRRGDGLQVLESLKDRKYVKVVIVSRLLRYASRLLLDELKLFNPRIVAPMPLTKNEIDLFSKTLVKELQDGDASNCIYLVRSYSLDTSKHPDFEGYVTIIGGSTGSLTPLYDIIRENKLDDSSSIVVALHIIKSKSVVEKIRRISKSPVIEVTNSERFEMGKIYVLKSGMNYHLKLKDGSLYFRTFKTRLGLGYRPSINLIMENFSAVFRERCTGVILSGYGNDGVLGSKLIAMRKGRMIIQDPKTAKASSMPKATIEMMERLGEPFEILK